MGMLSLLSSLAFATTSCPRLEGKYSCKSYELSVEQTEVASGVRYVFKMNGRRDEEIIATDVVVNLKKGSVVCSEGRLVFEEDGMKLYHEINSNGDYVLTGDLGGSTPTLLENCKRK